MPFTITRVGKKPWRYIPLASWNSDAPWITVLSRSKNAAAAGSARIRLRLCHVRVRAHLQRSGRDERVLG